MSLAAAKNLERHAIHRDVAQVEIANVIGTQLRRIELADLEDRAGFTGLTTRTLFAARASGPGRTALADLALRAWLTAFAALADWTSLPDVTLNPLLASEALKTLRPGLTALADRTGRTLRSRNASQTLRADRTIPTVTTRRALLARQAAFAAFADRAG